MQRVYGATLYDLMPEVDGLEETFCRAMWALDHSGKPSCTSLGALVLGKQSG